MKESFCGLISKLPLGCIVENDIVSDNGQLLISSMTVIDEDILSKLSHYNTVIYTTIHCDNGEETEKEIETKDVTISFDDSFKNYAVESIQTIYDNINKPDEIANNINKLSTELCTFIHNSDSLGINIAKLKVSDEYTYKHSVDVGTISAVIAAAMDMSEEAIHNIAVAGVLHDLGKEKIPLEIINKPARLTPEEFAIMKKHPVYGYQILRDAKEISEPIRQGVLNHHENFDGTGYPRGLKNTELHMIEKIIAVADVFDALVTARPYKTAKTPAQAIEIMFTMSNKFDINIFKSFLSVINAYPNGTNIKLSNGKEATVIAQNKSYPLRPIIRLNDTNEEINMSSDMEYLSVVIIN